jgi:uncharacterized protein
MQDIEIVEYKEVDLKNSMLVVAFPTVGLISSIAGHFIIDTLNLEPIGTILSDKFMPATVVHKSVPSPPVRIYSGEKQCGPNESCKNLALVISEFMPPNGLIRPLVNSIFNWAEKKGCQIVLTFEGIHALDEQNMKKPRIFGIATTNEMKKQLDCLKIKQTNDGMITGVSGVLLYQGQLMEKDVICMLAESHAKYPDSRAAAELIKKLDKMLPEIKIDPKPLLNSAKKIEDAIVQSMQQSKPTAP